MLKLPGFCLICFFIFALFLSACQEHSRLIAPGAGASPGPTQPVTPLTSTHTKAPSPTTKLSVVTPPPSETPLPAESAFLARVDAQRSGVYAESGNYGNWTFQGDGSPLTSPVIDGQVLYLASEAGTLYALDLDSRQLVWQRQLSAGVVASPLVYAGMLYVPMLDGELVALELASGNLLWTFNTQAPLRHSPAAADGAIYLGSTDGYLFALNASDGTQHWSYRTGKAVESSPALLEDYLIACSQGVGLFALDRQIGDLRWSETIHEECATPAISGDRVIVADNSIGIFNLQDGKLVRWDRPPWFAAPVAVREGVVYGGTQNGSLLAYQVETGKFLWSFNSKVPMIASPAVTNDLVISGGADGKVYAVDRQSGSLRWQFQTFGEIRSAPSIAGNTAFVASSDGNLYALDLAGPQLALNPTPTPLALAPQSTPVPAPSSPPAAGINGLPWWNERIFYLIYVRSFQDSNADGHGDLDGLLNRLDYLNDGDPSTDTDLGVTGLWLMPVMESPTTHGYDTLDYRRIEQDYGDNAIFKKLVEECHRRGMVLIIDLVLHNTSIQHPWFVQSVIPGSYYENWYQWAGKKPNITTPWGTEVWRQADFYLDFPRRYHSLFDYFYAYFWSGSPNLNLRNPSVTTELLDIARFWLEEMGVDGFRLDAIGTLINSGAQLFNTPETHLWLQNFDRFIHTVKPDALTVGEIWEDTRVILPYVPNEVKIAFEFRLAEALIRSINDGDPSGLKNQLNLVLKSYPKLQFATFLTNHDQTRLMDQVGGNWAKARLAATLLFALPGVPFMYYGEEIGLPGNLPAGSIRSPMQWDASENAGFTTGPAWTEFSSSDPVVNVAYQDGVPVSLLNHYRKLIRLRQAHPTLLAGDTWLVQSDQPQVFGLIRHDPGGESVLLVANLSGSEVGNFSLSLSHSPLKDNLSASLLDCSGQEILTTLTAPQINPQGGFAGYTPFPSALSSYGACLILLED